MVVLFLFGKVSGKNLFVDGLANGQSSAILAIHGASTFWPALIGYALGSAQILVIDWIRARTTHRRQLRLLRAELRRLSGFARKYNWEHDELPADDTHPNPPTVIPARGARGLASARLGVILKQPNYGYILLSMS